RFSRDWSSDVCSSDLWISKPKESILMTVIMQPSVQYELGKFTFSAQVANICADWMEEIYGVKVKIKWPNDLYINDRKAGGILIRSEERRVGKEGSYRR